MARRRAAPSVCPYCRQPFVTRDGLVEHLTVDGGCPKRNDYSPRHRGRRS